MSRGAVLLPEVMGLPASTNRRQREAAFRWLRIAMEKELTARQRDCLLRYYRDHCTMVEIARRLGLTKSTVCRHIQKATARLKRAAKYAPLSGDHT